MTDPLSLTFVVGCRPETAFHLWTEAIGTWWPADHTITGDPALVALEGRVGTATLRRTCGAGSSHPAAGSSNGRRTEPSTTGAG